MKEEKIEKVEWKAPEYEFSPKSPDWFWALGIITIAISLSAFFLNNILFGIFALLAGFSLALYGKRRPKIISFSVGPTGLRVENRTYPYGDLRAFWINYFPPHKKELIIESKKVIMPHINIMLGEADPVKIRLCLIKFLKEEKIEESLIDNIFRLIGF